MQRAALGCEVTLAGRRLAFGKPVRQVFEPIDQADTQCDAISLPPLAGEQALIFPSPACGGGQGGG